MLARTFVLENKSLDSKLCSFFFFLLIQCSTIFFFSGNLQKHAGEKEKNTTYFALTYIFFSWILIFQILLHRFKWPIKKFSVYVVQRNIALFFITSIGYSNPT